MTRGRLAAFACFGFLLIEAGLFFAAPAEMVSVTVVGYTTNKWDAESAAELGEESYVCAIVGFTNVSDRVITYDSYSPGSALGCVVMVDPQNDETEYGLALCGTGLSSYRLAPMQGFTFETVVPIDRACRIADRPLSPGPGMETLAPTSVDLRASALFVRSSVPGLGRGFHSSETRAAANEEEACCRRGVPHGKSPACFRRRACAVLLVWH